MLPMSMISGCAKRDFDLPTMVSIFMGRSGPSRRLNSTCSASLTGRSLRITQTAWRCRVSRNVSTSRSSSATPEISVKNMSLHLHVGGLGDARPARDLALDEGGELLRRVAEHLDAELLQALGGVGLLQELAKIRVDPTHELGRGRARHYDAVDAEHAEARNRLGHRGHLGRRRIALAARDRDRLHLARLDVTIDAEGGIELQVDAARHELRIGLGPALERHMQDIDTRFELQQLTRQVHRAAKARARVGELAGLLLRKRDDLGEAVGR